MVVSISVIVYWGLDVAAGDAFLDKLCHVGGTEFAHDAFAVELDGVVADEEALGDVACHQSLGDEVQDLDLAAGEAWNCSICSQAWR